MHRLARNNERERERERKVAVIPHVEVVVRPSDVLEKITQQCYTGRPKNEDTYFHRLVDILKISML